MSDSNHVCPYRLIGGEAGVERLVKVFYDLVESEPEGEPLAAMHIRGHGIAHAREAQFAFMSGFLGGPQLYAERNGHSNVRKMHAHLQIGTIERDAWLSCMNKALQTVVPDVHTRNMLMTHFVRIAEALRNRP
jgi:hemoglobin